MKKFRFPLEKVLELRVEEERTKAAELASARREADDARKKREQIESARDTSRARLTEAHGSGGTVGHLQNLEYVVGQMDSQLADADAACQAADEQVESSRDHFTRAFRSRRTLDHLREKRLADWRLENGRQEQKSIDETAITRHGRDADGGSGGGP